MKDEKSTLSVLALILVAGLVVIIATSDAEMDFNQVAMMTEATHGKNAEPDFDVVFPGDRVNEITIRLTPENWGQLTNEMTELYGPYGSGDQALNNPRVNHVWTEATIEFNGMTWEHVGLRFKGDLSLRDPWILGTMKLPFKLDFNMFGDIYEKYEDQRFYGFEQLTLANNLYDPSLIRD